MYASRYFESALSFILSDNVCRPLPRLTVQVYKSEWRTLDTWEDRWTTLLFSALSLFSLWITFQAFAMDQVVVLGQEISYQRILDVSILKYTHF
jgi:hypothetical protein